MHDSKILGRRRRIRGRERSVHPVFQMSERSFTSLATNLLQTKTQTVLNVAVPQHCIRIVGLATTTGRRH